MALPRTLDHERTAGRLLASLLVVLFALAALPEPAGAEVDPDAEARFVQLINRERTARGLAALELETSFLDVGRRHSDRMADRGGIYHNPDLRDEVCCWRNLGENVGYGPTVERIHELFMESDSHRANILSSAYTEAAVAVERRDGTIWVTEIFRRPDGSAARSQQAAPAGSPPAPPPSEPAPEPRTSATPEPATPPPPPPPPCPDGTSTVLAHVHAEAYADDLHTVLAAMCRSG